MIGTMHMAYDQAAGAIHFDLRPPDADEYLITRELLIELVEARAKSLPGRVVVVRHDLLGSHIDVPEPPRRITAHPQPTQSPPGTVIEGRVL